MSVGSCAILQTVHHISPLKFCLSDLTKEVAILYPDEKKEKGHWGKHQWHLLGFRKQRLEEGQPERKRQHSQKRRARGLQDA